MGGNPVSRKQKLPLTLSNNDAVFTIVREILGNLRQPQFSPELEKCKGVSACVFGFCVRVFSGFWRRVSFLSVTGQLKDSSVMSIDLFVFLFECNWIVVLVQSFANTKIQ